MLNKNNKNRNDNCNSNKIAIVIIIIILIIVRTMGISIVTTIISFFNGTHRNDIVRV